ncbi:MULTISPECIES: YbfB/YjiJ family MFS transporter [unclassified Acinetobacter]|uniref:YbfB/YjiJ family MFS transporter n=1 Tax=unclassified Acinetobacter TaxID=196816 RepID=UPI002934CFC7|nr:MULTISPECIES: YbfB/YjiJ family MFS transporter [unclassified Acinetobacter]WOE32491.1 YbfB/YjiJ family MFS transporter [Acinetobacter sp. SAAs470]WOE37967.1 YbfB/YjiJ family MFS transporter [Acinetobacter sp. SAAs474]
MKSQIKLSLFLCLSMCLGIGILRFSYTALLPYTRDAFGWSTAFASILSSANLLGYLIGAFSAMRLPQTKIMSSFIQIAAILGMISLFCCAFDGFNSIWYIFWRIISGISGGLLMILSPSIVALCAGLNDRLKINFIGFSGIGLGVLISTCFLSYLDRISIQTAWLILCSTAFLICIYMIYALRQFKKELPTSLSRAVPTAKVNILFYSLLFAYSSSAFAYIPHSLFWIDYLSQDLNIALSFVNFNWILYGIGSALGAFVGYLFAKRIGNFNALKVLYSIYIVAIMMATLSFNHVFILASSFLTGLLNPAVVFLTSYTILQLYGLSYKKLWSIATLSFAAIQLIGGLSFSYLQKIGFSYHQQFVIGSLVLFIGTLQLFIFLKSENSVAKLSVSK